MPFYEKIQKNADGNDIVKLWFKGPNGFDSYAEAHHVRDYADEYSQFVKAKEIEGKPSSELPVAPEVYVAERDLRMARQVKEHILEVSPDKAEDRKPEDLEEAFKDVSLDQKPGYAPAANPTIRVPVDETSNEGDKQVKEHEEALKKSDKKGK